MVRGRDVARPRIRAGLLTTFSKWGKPILPSCSGSIASKRASAAFLSARVPSTCSTFRNSLRLM